MHSGVADDRKGAGARHEIKQHRITMPGFEQAQLLETILRGDQSIGSRLV